MTKEKQAWLEEISIKAKELRGYNVNSSDSKAQQDMMRLITELKSAWAREAELVKALKKVIAGPDDYYKQNNMELGWILNEILTAVAQHKASLEK